MRGINKKKPAEPPTCLKHNYKMPDNTNFNCKVMNLYYWTHGYYNHEGKDYTLKVPGYYDKANKDNKIGGSKAFYSWQYELGNEFHSKINSVCYNLPEDLYYSKTKLKIIIAKGGSAASYNY